MPLPTAWTMVHVFGTYLRIDGTPNQGSVTFELEQEVVIQNDAGVTIGVLPRRQVAKLDETGSFSIMLPATDDPHIAPTGWTYQITEGFNAGQRPYSIEVPLALATTGGLNLVNYPHAVPVPVNPPVVTYLRVSDIGTLVASQSDMQHAIDVANNASSQAAAAVATANTAAADADNALTVANGIDAKAQLALDQSTAAVATANAASDTANAIDGKAQAALDASADAVNTADQALAALGPIGTGDAVLGKVLVSNGANVPPIYQMFNQGDAGAVDRTYLQKLMGWMDVLDYGVVGDGVADDTAALNAAIARSVARNKPLTASGITMKITSTVNFPTRLNADFTGSVIVADAAMTAGFAITVGGTIGIGSKFVAGRIEGLTLFRNLISGHADPTSNVDGISFTSAGGQTSDMTWNNTRVFGFRDNMVFGQNAYLLMFHSTQCGCAWRRGISAVSSANAGENVSFFGGSIFNVNNTSFNGTAVYYDTGQSTFQFNLFGVSLDYCDYSADMNCGRLNLFGCHLENNNTNPHIRMTYNPSAGKPALVMRGGSMAGGPGVTSWTGITPEPATGRPAFVLVAGTGAADVDIDGTECGTYHASGLYATEIVSVTPGTGAGLRRANIKPTIDWGIPINLCFALNKLQVSTTNLANYLYQSASGGSMSFDNTVSYSPDVASRKFVGTAASSISLSQTVACEPGQMVHAKAMVRATTLTAGYMAVRLQFLGADGQAVLQDTIGTQQTSADGSWRNTFVMTEAPPGTVSCKMQLYCNGFTGTGWFSNEHLWIW